MKKILAFLCSLLLVMSVIVGCGGDKKEAKPSAPAKVTAQVETKAQATQSTKKVAAQDNYKANRQKISISESGAYTDKVRVAAYINQFAKLPHNYITKGEAKKLGWQTKGTLDKVAPGKSIGGDKFGNYEKILPVKKGRVYRECDIDYKKGNRNAKRIVYSNDGLIYYTGDHYKTFTKLY